MRYVAMQVLTWGTIVGAIGSALLLAALGSPPLRYPSELPSVWPLLGEPAQAGRPVAKAASTAAPSAASSPVFVAR